MRKALWWACFLAGSLAALQTSAAAQEVIHALTGTVSSIDSADSTITVFQDNGTRGVFQEMGAKHRVSLDKRIAADTTAVNAFNKQGAYVIVFYYGADDRTVVAVKNLGAGPFASATGTFKKIESHSHTLILTDNSGAELSFKIEPQTVAEGTLGAVEGLKFDGQKGDRIRVVSTKVDGTPTALFISEM